ncbi:MAG TPA: hypothetical protein VJH34_00690 [archaeon]|nr:hypothetical protein [archaeon]
MSDLEYVTNRDLTNSQGKSSGKIKILKMHGEDAQVEFVCPECGFKKDSRVKWMEPFVNGAGSGQYFLLVCGKCNQKTKILRLKKELKKK